MRTVVFKFHDMEFHVPTEVDRSITDLTVFTKANTVIRALGIGGNIAWYDAGEDTFILRRINMD